MEIMNFLFKKMHLCSSRAVLLPQGIPHGPPLLLAAILLQRSSCLLPKGALWQHSFLHWPSAPSLRQTQGLPPPSCCSAVPQSSSLLCGHCSLQAWLCPNVLEIRGKEIQSRFSFYVSCTHPFCSHFIGNSLITRPNLSNWEILHLADSHVLRKKGKTRLQ